MMRNRRCVTRSSLVAAYRAVKVFPAPVARSRIPTPSCFCHAARAAVGTAVNRVPNSRQATELPWQLLRETDNSDPNHEKPAAWDAPAAVLCDLEFVEVKWE